MKINEDWLSVIVAFALMILAMVGVIGPWLDEVLVVGNDLFALGKPIQIL